MPSANVAAVFTPRSCRWKTLGHTLHHRTLCSVKGGRRRGADPSTHYSATVQLPRTSLPFRVSAANRAQLEASVQQAAGFDSLYAWQRGQNREKEFVLHDGPPYANGRPHIGHAVNKILKDITLRQKLLQGYKVHYIPGWDCHGLPIELKATQVDKRKKTPANQLSSYSDPLEIRNNAQRFAKEALEIQRSVFRRWGLLADWSEVYRTLDPQYVTRQLHLFIDLYEKGFIYQDYKPVYFSPNLGTSLAEAELEYEPQHVSPSVFLALPVTSALPATLDRLPSAAQSQLYLPIWTTTPWTLPLNQAICFAPDKPYLLVWVYWKNRRLALVWSEELLHELERIVGKDQVTVMCHIEEQELAALRYQAPLDQRECPCLPGTHVTMVKGTGLVHTAPAHGHEDFLMALQYKLPVECQVDEQGKFMDGVMTELRGLKVLEEGNHSVLQLLTNTGGPRESLLLKEELYTHSYPYDWRTRKPVIIRATKQWFIDTHRIKEAALAALEKVEILPQRLEAGMIRQLKNRPYWCISRQRVWGTPIPVFYDPDTSQPIVDRSIIQHVAKVLEEEGSDSWWSKGENDLLPPALIEKLQKNGKPLPKKGSDILDIWFDSGSSWHCVLGAPKADLYLEGVDQFNGWFLSSLLTSVAATGKAPYRMIYVHGFALDEHGRKMSKSLGNVVDPQEVTDGGKDSSRNPAYGADVLRWWVGSHAADHSTMSIGQQHLEQGRDSVQKIRAVLRFLLGSVRDYQPCQHSLPVQDLRPIDRYMLHLLHGHIQKIWLHYNNFHYNWVTKASLTFINTTLSGLYISSIRDRLYCDARLGSRRMSALLVLHHLLHQLLLSLAPILPHLAEEVAQHLTDNKDWRVFHQVITELPSSWHQPQLASAFEQCLTVREGLFKSSPASDWSKLQVHITAEESLMENLRMLQTSHTSSHSGLCELLQVSHVTLETDQDQKDGFSLRLSKAQGGKCLRCRRYTTEGGAELCARCLEVISSHE
uniref:isoleucine--tRNA ligase n=1 Tax=Scylla olivacea TaxID=85551 RepID=A0A0P4W8B8_SCYOL